ncbi:hypothetical protein C8D77_101394 [Mesorhizobium loti]|uniref:Uncharacterized protein n=2 Tax=Mesorhizobium TaxID=68287 RepID=A0A8E2WIS0_RHILI|nr:hypothetical protein C8D77_101394 [Mesorhizobium loti]
MLDTAQADRLFIHHGDEAVGLKFALQTKRLKVV